MFLTCVYDQECLKSSWCLCCLGKQRNVENVETNDKRQRVYTEHVYVLNAALRYLAYYLGSEDTPIHSFLIPYPKGSESMNSASDIVLCRF
jgi:hypothetical protein